ncbi:MAG: response regulator, partial [bacterium]
ELKVGESNYRYATTNTHRLLAPAGSFVVSSTRTTSLPATQQPMFSRECGVRPYMANNGKTVLLVEDNEDNRIVYSTILRHFGYEVIEALNGEEGIAKARSEKPDLILMDISIPIIDGWEATQVLKHDPATRDIPIIALTAHALASDREKAMEVGCDGYLAKPCEPRAVVAEVQRFLGKDAARNTG